MKNIVLNPLLTESLTKRHQMHSDVDKLAKRDKCRIECINGSAIQPPKDLKKSALNLALVVLACAVWFFVGAGVGFQF